MSKSIMAKLKKNSKLMGADVLSDSKFYDENRLSQIQCPTQIPMINVALSGKPNGGLSPGILMIAGDSKHFKTGFMLECAKGFQEKHEDGIILFYDSEKGAPIDYFKTRNINMDMVFHSPIMNIEELKFDVVKQVDLLVGEGVPVMIMVDSIGMLPSIREVQNAENENSAADMTRAKELASLFRILTPKLAFGDIPMVVINHTYDSMDGKGAKTVSGGKKIYLATDDVWIIGRRQVKDGPELTGFQFVLNIDKSRCCIEKTKIFIDSTFEEGININSGLLDEAQDLGYVELGAWCKRMDWDTGEMSSGLRRKDLIKDDEWFARLLEDEDFINHLKEKYTLSN